MLRPGLEYGSKPILVFAQNPQQRPLFDLLLPPLRGADIQPHAEAQRRLAAARRRDDGRDAFGKDELRDQLLAAFDFEKIGDRVGLQRVGAHSCSAFSLAHPSA